MILWLSTSVSMLSSQVLEFLHYTRDIYRVPGIEISSVSKRTYTLSLWWGFATIPIPRTAALSNEKGWISTEESNIAHTWASSMGARHTDKTTPNEELYIPMSSAKIVVSNRKYWDLASNPHASMTLHTAAKPNCPYLQCWEKKTTFFVHLHAIPGKQSSPRQQCQINIYLIRDANALAATIP